MQLIKKLKIFFPILALTLIFSGKAYSADECFENVSRGIFKFNQGFDKARRS